MNFAQPHDDFYNNNVDDTNVDDTNVDEGKFLTLIFMY